MNLETDLQALFVPEAIPDPFPRYETVRQHGNVLPVPQWNTSFVLGWEGVQKLFRHPSISSNRIAMATGLEDTASLTLLKHMMLFHDGANHARLRGLVSQAFTPKAVAETAEFIEGTVQQLLQHQAQQGGNFVENVAVPLPLLVILELMGLKDTERDKLKQWSVSIAALLDGGSFNPETFPQIEQNIVALREYFQGIADDLRVNPRPGILSAMANADGDVLSGDELLANAALLMAAGHETTTNLISGAMLEFARQPGAWQTLLAQPELVGNTVEELLRIISPVTMTDRVLREPLELDGITLAVGNVTLMLAAANRDAKRFPNPQTLDPSRPNAKEHVAFASGPHYCLGAPLARLEAKTFLEVLTKSYPEFRVDTTNTPYRNNYALRGLQYLSVKL